MKRNSLPIPRHQHGALSRPGPLFTLVAATLGMGLVWGCQTDDPSRGGNLAIAPAASAERVPPKPLPRAIRAVWVARFHYRYPDDVRIIMRNCAALGANTVLWQVRGAGDVLYPSEIEPWSSEFGHADPGWDPLKLAVEEAHANGLRIEAWANTMPGWRGPNPPPIPNQLWNTRPEWFLHDAKGRRQALVETNARTKKAEPFYVILNPCLPEVRRYITSVMREIVTKYDVDGLHLDYIRYAWDTTENAEKLYPRDPQTLELYRRQTGKGPDDDPAAWKNWRANQLTRLVQDVREVVDRVRPGASLTAAVWSNPKKGYNDYFQNAGAWLRSGLLDAAMPMIYTDKVEDLERNMAAYQELAPRAHLVPGLGLYKHERPEQLAVQLERCRAWGGDYALFSYDSLHANQGDRLKKQVDQKTQELREMRRALVAQSSRRKPDSAP